MLHSWVTTIAYISNMYDATAETNAKHHNRTAVWFKQCTTVKQMKHKSDSNLPTRNNPEHRLTYASIRNQKQTHDRQFGSVPIQEGCQNARSARRSRSGLTA